MKKRLLVATLVAIGPLLALAQNVITGRVIDAKTGEPLIGASVIVKTDRQGVATDVDGNFSLTTKKEFPLTLHLDFIGYRGLDLDVYDNSEPVEIKLQENYRFTEEIVVIGYGQQKRSDLTGSISAVSADQIKNIAASSFDNALAGTIPGLQATPVSGQPGGGVSIRIRGGSTIQGGNEPLYVIDGFPIYNSSISAGVATGAGTDPLSSINPGDIESVTVLKDASATAIYGSRGANGVVIVTTKQGKAGKVSVTYDGSIGLQTLRKKIDVLNAREFASLRNDALYDTYPEKGKYQYLSQTEIDALGDGVDWQDAAFRTALTTNHQLTISGGNDKTRFAVTGNYYDQDGIIIGTDFRRFSGRVNIDTKVSSKLKVGVNLTASRTDSNVLPTGTNPNNGVSMNMISALLEMPPTATIYDETGNYTIRNPFETAVSNPIAVLELGTNTNQSTKLLGTAFGEFEFIKNLKLKVLLGVDLNSVRQNSYVPSTVWEGASVKGHASVGDRHVDSWLNENTLTYNTTLNKVHNLDFLIGFTQQKTSSDILRAGSSEYLSDDLTFHSLQSGAVIDTPYSNSSSNVLLSFLGRINYDYNQRHYISLSLRRDGSSRFGKDRKWGTFPSVGYSWFVSNEPFFKVLKNSVSTLKFRVSYGVTGNQEIGNYQSLSTLTNVPYLFGDRLVNGNTPSRISNDELGWETTKQIDAGLDFSFFNDRLSLSVDYYHKKTSDLLMDVEVPYTTGYTTSLQNYGSVLNKGMEFAISSKNFIGKFKWDTTANLSFNRNEVVSIGGESDYYVSGNYIVKIGEPLGTFYGAVVDGVLQKGEEAEKGAYTGNGKKAKAGDRLYKDINGDGSFTTAGDKDIIGNFQPDFIFGLTNNFEYKGFDLSIFLQGTIGNDILNGTRSQIGVFNGQINADGEARNRWREDAPSQTVPRAKQDPSPVFSNWYVEDGSFIRLKNLTLGYTLPQRLTQTIGISRLRLYASATNLITWTKYSGYDPEITSSDNSVTAGFDNGKYPVATTINFGVSAQF